MVSFTLQERRALLLLFSLAAFYLLMDFLPRKQEKTYTVCLDDMVGFQEQILAETTTTNKPAWKKKSAWKEKSDWKEKPDWNKKQIPSKTENQLNRNSTGTHNYFSFDPNTVSLDSLMLLGFDKKVSERWIKFRNKGKVYSDLNDLNSIYGIDNNHLKNLSSFISFPQESSLMVNKPAEKFEKEKAKDAPIALDVKKVDLNLCDKEDLRALGGIGKVYATRILKYREILGGYASIEQLREVYGLTDSTFQIIKNFVTIETPPDKIKINTQSLDELSSNFLIKYKAAKTIHAYRTEHGPFVDIEDFKKVRGLKKDFVEQIIPYLDFAL